MEYLDNCSTTIRHVARKVGLYDLEVVSPQRCYFQTGRLAYDSHCKVDLYNVYFKLHRISMEVEMILK